MRDLICSKFNLKDILIKFKKEEFYELVDDVQQINMLSVVQEWISNEPVDGIINIDNPFKLFVERKGKTSKIARLLNKKIGSVINFGLYRFDYIKNSEVERFRRVLLDVGKDAVEGRDLFKYLLDVQVETLQCPPVILQNLFNGKIKIKIHLAEDVRRTAICDCDSTPAAFVDQFLSKTKNSKYRLDQEYLLKVVGQNVFLHGEHKMIDFMVVREALRHQKLLSLSIISVNDFWALIENFSGTSLDRSASTGSVASATDTTYEDCRIENVQNFMGSHSQLSIRNDGDLQKAKYYSLWDFTENKLRIKIVNMANIEPFTKANGSEDILNLVFEARVMHGNQLLGTSEKLTVEKSLRLSQWLEFDTILGNLPRAARVIIKVQGQTATSTIEMGSLDFTLLDHRGFLKMGRHSHNLSLEEGRSGHFAAVDPKKAILTFMLETFDKPVVYPYEEANAPIQLEFQSHDGNFEIILNQLLDFDPLVELDKAMKRFIWNNRFQLMKKPKALPKFVLAIDYSNLTCVLEAHKLLNLWKEPGYETALQLLDAQYADPVVREYAVKIISKLDDKTLNSLLLQLVQVLKYEPYMDNELSKLLLKRALRNRTIGHGFFWYLKSEMHNPENEVRFASLLEAYLRNCSSYIFQDLELQTQVQTELNDIALAIKKCRSQDRKDLLIQKLDYLNQVLPRKFTLSVNNKLQASRLVLEKCRYMDSKKLPLWCVFKNTDSLADPLYVIFKSGDDLRQDMLTLQMLKIMDTLWLNRNMDLKLLPYECISTGDEMGMIQVVLQAQTVSNIQRKYGGSSAAFKDQPIAQWIKDLNPDQTAYAQAVNTFIKSCAGYCVATFVLGIGDRHNDNIMVTQQGNLFHIDFGHFLGNIKRKFGIKRERAPFVLTPDFVYVMNSCKEGVESKYSNGFEYFQDLCLDAYLVLHEHAHFFINLFAMMISTGIPELTSHKDIYYLRDALCVGKTENEAREYFKTQISESLRLGWSTQLNWWIHNLAHR
jgi:phosphatidylinositol-4,5-bisphosphate 3-kinase